MTEDFNGKVVLVTGARSGIGREAATAFAGRGAYGSGANWFARAKNDLFALTSSD